MARILTPQEQDRYFDDLDAFLENRCAGGLDKWLYKHDDEWEALVTASNENSSSYYLARTETPILSQNSASISQELEGKDPVTTLFVRGTGTGEKIVPLVTALNGQLRTALLFDLSAEFTTTAKDLIEHHRPDLHIHEINWDFELDTNRFKSNQNTLGVELGGTLFNISTADISEFPEAKLKARLERFVAQFDTTKKNWVLITQHINPDDDAVLKNYNDELNHSFALNALDLATELPDTDPNLDLKSLFKHTPELRILPDGNRVVLHTITPNFTGDKIFKIRGKQYTLSDTFRNSTINSYLPSEQQFDDISTSIGLHMRCTYLDSDRRIAIHLMEYEAPNPTHSPKKQNSAVNPHINLKA